MVKKDMLEYNDYRNLKALLKKQGIELPKEFADIHKFVEFIGPKPDATWELPKVKKDYLLKEASSYYWRKPLPKMYKAYDEYTNWKGLRSRCNSPSIGKLRDYQSKGITVCDRWDDFYNFYKDMGPKPTSKHSVDRIDNSKGYNPTNCRWADDTLQARNQGKVKTFTVQDFTGCIPEIAEHFKVNSNSLHKHMQNGKTIDEALTSLQTDKRIHYKGLALPKSGWADLLGVKRPTMYHRFNTLPIEEVLKDYKG